MTYADQLDKAAGRTSRQVVAAVSQWEAGRLSTEGLVGLVVRHIAAGNGAAAVLADTSLAAVLTTKLGRAIAPLGITRPADEPARLRKAATTLSGVDEATSARWDRLARAEVHTAAAEAYSEGVRRSRYVSGWTRGLEAQACQLCEWWSRGGRTWPDTHPMPTHNGCSCVPVPVTT